jgi:phage-related protein
MKQLTFLGDSLNRLREFPEDIRHDIGYLLDRVQRGQQPFDFKPMSMIGKGVEEIRIWDESGTYRIIYLARFPEVVYVLHAFQKKTKTTAGRDIDMARKRYTELIRGLQ